MFWMGREWQLLHVFYENKNTAMTAGGWWLIIQINHHLSLFKPETELAELRQTKQMLLLADLQWEIGTKCIKYSTQNIQNLENGAEEKMNSALYFLS